MADEDEVRITLRMPKGVRDRVAEAAGISGRSLNSEIVARLEGSFSGPFSDQRAGELLEAIRDLVVAQRLVDTIGDWAMEALDEYVFEMGLDDRSAALEDIIRKQLKADGDVGS